jgi:hypothetical protein
MIKGESRMADFKYTLCDLTPYEKMQIAEIRQWKATETDIVNKLTGIAIDPLVKVMQKAIPEVLLTEFLNFSHSVAQTLE